MSGVLKISGSLTGVLGVIQATRSDGTGTGSGGSTGGSMSNVLLGVDISRSLTRVLGVVQAARSDGTSTSSSRSTGVSVNNVLLLGVDGLAVVLGRSILGGTNATSNSGKSSTSHASAGRVLVQPVMSIVLISGDGDLAGRCLFTLSLGKTVRRSVSRNSADSRNGRNSALSIGGAATVRNRSSFGSPALLVEFVGLVSGRSRERLALVLGVLVLVVVAKTVAGSSSSASSHSSRDILLLQLVAAIILMLSSGGVLFLVVLVAVEDAEKTTTVLLLSLGGVVLAAAALGGRWLLCESVMLSSRLLDSGSISMVMRRGLLEVFRGSVPNIEGVLPKGLLFLLGLHLLKRATRDRNDTGLAKLLALSPVRDGGSSTTTRVVASRVVQVLRNSIPFLGKGILSKVLLVLPVPGIVDLVIVMLLGQSTRTKTSSAGGKGLLVAQRVLVGILLGHSSISSSCVVGSQGENALGLNIAVMGARASRGMSIKDISVVGAAGALLSLGSRLSEELSIITSGSLGQEARSNVLAIGASYHTSAGSLGQVVRSQRLVLWDGSQWGIEDSIGAVDSGAAMTWLRDIHLEVVVVQCVAVVGSLIQVTLHLLIVAAMARDGVVNATTWNRNVSTEIRNAQGVVRRVFC